MIRFLAVAVVAAFVTRANAAFPVGARIEGWPDVRALLADRSITSEWRDDRGRSLAYYHLVFGAEDDALNAVRGLKFPRDKEEIDGLLQIAAMMDAQRLVPHLLDIGATADGAGSASPLMLAAERGHLEIMRLLIKGGGRSQQ